MIELKVLGSPTLTGHDGGQVLSVLAQPKRLALLTYLSLEATGTYVRRDTLLGLFWPESDESHARAALSSHLYALKKSLGEGVLRRRGNEEVGIETDSLDCDVRRFEAEAAGGNARRAAELYGGDLLEGLILDTSPEFDRWLEQERTELRRTAVAAIHRVIDTSLESGDGEARGWAEKALAVDPYDGSSARRLMTILATSGHRAAALEFYEGFANALGADRGIEPARETEDLASRIRSGQVAATSEAPVPAAHAEKSVRFPETPSPAQRDAGRSSVPSPRAALSAGSVRLGAAGAVGLLIGLALFMSWQGRPEAHFEPTTFDGRPSVEIASITAAALDSEASLLLAETHAALTRGLALVGGLRVYGETEGSIALGPNATGGDRSSADFVLRGELTGPGAVNAAFQLIRADNEAVVWAGHRDSGMKPDDPALPSKLSAWVVAELPAHVPTRQWFGSIQSAEGPVVLPPETTPVWRHYWSGAAALHGWATGGRDALLQARDHFEAAVELDEEFLLGWLWLTEANAMLYGMFGRRPADAAAAEAASEIAWQLDPNSAEALAARALYERRVVGDLMRASALMRRADAIRPNSTHILQWRGYIERDLGRIDESVELLERTLWLDPEWEGIKRQLALVLMTAREWDRAEALLEEIVSDWPTWGPPRGDLSMISWHRDGDTGPRRDHLTRVGSDIAAYRTQWWQLEVGDDRYERALEVLARAGPQEDGAQPTSLLRARTFVAMGDLPRARSEFERAREALEASVMDRPEDERLRRSLAEVYASLDMRDEAGAQMVEAARLTDPSHAARMQGNAHAWAIVHARLGDQELALARLEHLLEMPGQYTVHGFRLDPRFDSLRGSPEFLRLESRETR